MATKSSRRQVLKSALGGAVLAGCGVSTGRRILDSNTLDGESAKVFRYGVASGDPKVDGVILWTSVAEEFYVAGEILRVEVANDQSFNDVWSTFEVPEFGPARDYTAAIDISGMASDRYYYYRFSYRGVYSRTGRARTLPDSNALKSKLSIAVLTCQDYTTGYFTAYRHLAKNNNVDFAVHVGDFIYEYNEYPGFKNAIKRRPGISGPFALGLTDYRTIFKAYREDQDLQDAMAAHTFIITLDDHEIADNVHFNYRNNVRAVGYYAADPHPYAVNPVGDPVFSEDQKRILRKLVAEAMQAWREYTPTRITQTVNYNGNETPVMYRDFRFGKLAHIFMTDSRSYRNREACVEGTQIANSFKCWDSRDPNRTMLGPDQKKWLTQGMLKAKDQVTWKIWGNQTLLSECAIRRYNPFRKGGVQFYLNQDAWDGYQAERQAILKSFRDRGMRDLVVLTGDFHVTMASKVAIDYDANDLDVVGIELMTPSVSSPHLEDSLNAATEQYAWLTKAIGISGKTVASVLMKHNTHYDYFTSNVYGYAVCDFYRDYLQWTVYGFDKTNLSGDVTSNSSYYYTRKVLRDPSGQLTASIEKTDAPPRSAVRRRH